MNCGEQSLSGDLENVEAYIHLGNRNVDSSIDVYGKLLIANGYRVT